MLRDHRRLRAFELSDHLVVAVYEATGKFPPHELFGLTSQLRRAAVSVPANIVEGCGRETVNDYRHFLTVAFGSLRELGYLVDLSGRLGYLEKSTLDSLRNAHDEAARVLAALLRGTPRRSSRQTVRPAKA